MQIIYKSIKEIKPYEKNPRKNDEAVEYVANSIKEFGFKVPIIIDKEGTIVAGHTRYKASKKLGLEQVPCIIADDLSEEQIKAFRIADNKVGERSEWDLDLLSEELDKIKDIDMGLFDVDVAGIQDITEEYEIVEDDVPLVDYSKPPIIEQGEIYKLGRHYLMCGDSTKREDVEKLLSAERTEPVVADILYTDPPYNVDIENSEGMKIANDNLSEEQFKHLLNSSFKNASENLKEGGAFYIWYADGRAIIFRTSLKENGLTARQTLIWVKNSFVFGRQDYKWQHEPCIYGWKDGESHYFKPEFNHPTVIEDKLDLNKLSKEELKQLVSEMLEDHTPTTVIHENKPIKNDLHPTMKPVKICAHMIRNSTEPNSVCLDLFGGSGSTLIACEQINRICYMMEYESYYAEAIIKRWEALTGEKAIKLNKGGK